MDQLTLNDVALFTKKFNILDNGCWQWTASVDTKGYGKIGKTRNSTTKMYSAHRLAYFFTRGKLTEGLTIDHLCRNRRCVNPNHLEEVTQRENNSRSPLIRAHWDNQKNWSGYNTPKGICTRGHKMKHDGKRFRCLACQRKDY